MPTKPGTERARDEKRKSGGPRVHGRPWHDDPDRQPVDDPIDEPDIQEPPDQAAAEVEVSGEQPGRVSRHGQRPRVRSAEIKPPIRSPRAKPRTHRRTAHRQP